MIPYLHSPWGSIPVFPLFVALGVMTSLVLVFMQLHGTNHYIQEESYIFPKIAISGVCGYFSSGIADALFKLKINGGFKISGITFYGGFMGAAAMMFLLLVTTKRKTNRSVKEWFDLLTLPLIGFHFFGRIGCFFGGCCYGKPTDSIIGVVFPDNAVDDVVHQGVARYPTQLFEAAALFVIFMTLLRKRNKFKNYVVLYAVSRFIIEFFRGDERGEISIVISPSQIISMGMCLIVLIYETGKHIHSRRCTDVQK